MRLLQRLIQHLQHPPPWRWLCNDLFWQRVGTAPLWQLPLELLQQLHWWLIVPLRKGNHGLDLVHNTPLSLRLLACRLNSYRPRELQWWWAAGVRNWKELSCHIPESLVNQLHRERRHDWPGQCRTALEILRNKAALLELTPQSLRPAFQVLNSHNADISTPCWWWDSLNQSGLILKPIRGHAGRGVVHFRLNEQSLNQEGLFHQLPPKTPTWTATQPANPGELHRHWQEITGNFEPALASPYLNHCPLLPDTHPSVVVRVLTKQAEPGARIKVTLAWLEVPLADSAVAFLDLNGQPLPKPGEPFTTEQHEELQNWQEQMKGQGHQAIEACLEAAVTIHGLLPPIDQVAWDWIPADPEPLLLEGNGGFGQLVPQLFEYLRQSTDHTATSC